MIAKGLEVVGVALIDLNGNRFAQTVGQQSDDDLLFAFLAVAIIAPGGQSIVFALQIVVLQTRGFGLTEMRQANRPQKTTIRFTVNSTIKAKIWKTFIPFDIH